MKFISRCVATVAACCAGASILLAQTTIEKTIKVDGFERTYLLHIPRGSHSANKPVVMMLHGRGGTSQSTASDFGWIEKADQEGFIAVFPQALPIDPTRPSGAVLPHNLIQHWNISTNDLLWWTHKIAANYPYLANPNFPRIVHPPDVPFLTAVLNDVVKSYGGDKSRIYIAGFSSGGEMAADFAQFASAKIAAVAIVGSVGLSEPYQLPQPLSVFLAIGTDDRFGQPTQAEWDSMPVVARERWYGQESLPTLEQEGAVWAHFDGCKEHKVTGTSWGQRIRWSNCLKHVRVNEFSINHLSHEWPGSSPSQWNQAHPTQPPLRLTDIIWDFFQSTD